MRRLLSHPTAGKFRAHGSIEWPDDVYTRKRLADGSVKLVQQAPAAAPVPPPPPLPKPSEERRRRAREQEVKDEE
jgi:hypothetical protein